MTLDTMKIWRWFTPAVLIFVYGALLWFILWGTFPALPDISKAPYLVTLIIPAAIYYITPLRTWANKRSHDRINENLRSGMVKITGYKDNPEKYSWSSLRPLFYKLVDENKSLSVKASMAYFNGLLWTGFADSIVISTSFALISVGLFFFGTANAIIALVVFVAILVVSYLGNEVTTKRQITIGNEQLEHIKLEHTAAIEGRLNQLDRRPDTSGR